MLYGLFEESLVSLPEMYVKIKWKQSLLYQLIRVVSFYKGGAVIAVGNNPKLQSTEVKAMILKNATPGVVKSPGPDSPNLMLYIP